MKIVAVFALVALVGCSRNDKTATVEPVSTVTVTSAPITLPTPTTEEELDRRATLAAARSLPGVIETLNGMTALPSPPPEGDDQTTFHIQFALLQDDDFVDHASDVDVKVSHGMVTLRGNTTTPQARTAAERIAMRQPGVISVDNELRIGPAGHQTAPAHR